MVNQGYTLQSVNHPSRDATYDSVSGLQTQTTIKPVGLELLDASERSQVRSSLVWR
jgi:hypothetical protein